MSTKPPLYVNVYVDRDRDLCPTGILSYAANVFSPEEELYDHLLLGTEDKYHATLSNTGEDITPRMKKLEIELDTAITEAINMGMRPEDYGWDEICEAVEVEKDNWEEEYDDTYNETYLVRKRDYL